MSEAVLQSAFLLAAPAELPDLRLFRRNIGAARVGERTIKFAVTGQSDLYGMWRGGQHIEIELKAATGRLSVEQVLWQQWCQTWGVPHVVLKARKDESEAETVRRWCEEIRLLRS